jgi:hypothetical protein
MWVGPFTDNPTEFSSAQVPVSRGEFLQVKIVLSTDNNTSAPRVFSVDVIQDCQPVIS